MLAIILKQADNESIGSCRLLPTCRQNAKPVLKLFYEILMAQEKMYQEALDAIVERATCSGKRSAHPFASIRLITSRVLVMDEYSR